MPRPKYPKKLVSGDEVRVVALAGSLYGFDKQNFRDSQDWLNTKGLELSIGQHARKKNPTNAEKLADFHQALSDKKVRMVLAAAGGFDSNELLADIDYGLVAGTAKIIQGYSDITAVLNAITAKTGLVTYYGPNFGGIGTQEASAFTRIHLEQILFHKTAFELEQHKGNWYDKDYQKTPPKTQVHRNAEWWQLSKGIGLGRVVAGHIGTLQLLRDTDYAPKLKSAVLCIEADADYRPAVFRRELFALACTRDFGKLEAVLIGRFPSRCGVDRQWLQQLVADVPGMSDMPVIANIDFGHTNPKVTLPVGGEIAVRSQDDLVIRVTEH